VALRPALSMNDSAQNQRLGASVTQSAQLPEVAAPGWMASPGPTELIAV
jgi:hypothetical protein